MLKGKILTDFTNLFSPNNFKKNGHIVLNYFLTNLLKWLNLLSEIPLSLTPLRH